jgi:hypothetical protein
MTGDIIPFWWARSSRFGGRLRSESAREFLDRLQVEHPQLYRDGHLRTLQRRLKVLRRRAAQSLVLGSKSHPDESGRLREDLKIREPALS